MEEIKAPKKERKFLKAIGDVALTLLRELLLNVGKKVINKVGNKRQGLAIALVMVAGVSYASIDSIPYPITGNKQKLGWQTSGNGLVYRGTAADTVTKPSNYTNKDIKAYLLVDTVNNVMYSYIASKGGWKFNNSDTVIIQGATMPFDSITFNTAKDGTVGVGEVEYNDTQGSLIQGLKGGLVTNVIGQQLHQRVNNRTGATLTKGTAVYLSGSQGNRITVAKALGVTDAFSANTFGIVAESIANNQSGYVITEGLITNINTSSLVEDSAVYLSPTVAGGLTSTKPQAPQHTVYIGVCVKSNAGSGELFVKIRNGQELDELHDVRITLPVDKASLYYKSSEGLWRDTTAALLVSDTASMLTNYARIGTGGTVTSVGGTGTVNGITLTGTVTSSGNLTLGGTLSGVSLSSQVSGTLPIANGGTGATTAATARTALGATVRGANTFLLTDIGTISFLRYNADNTVSQRAADGMRSDLGGTTVGQSMFTLTNPSAVTFPRFNADNSVTALDAASFRTAIGAGTSNSSGTVTSVTGTTPISVATGTTTPAITIANAGVSTTGVVTASTQTFGGAKTFNGVLNASSDLNVTGIASLNGGVIIAPAGSMTKIAGLNVSNAIGSITVGSSLDLTSGTLNAKDASVSVSGIVNTTTQSFAGNKTFTGTIKTDKYIAVSGVTQISGNYTILDTDTYIVCSGSGTITITMPSGSAHTGRAITLKTTQLYTVISNSSNIIGLQNAAITTTAMLPATDGAWGTFVYDGTNWMQMAAGVPNQ